jgi:hypothetical protein
MGQASRSVKLSMSNPTFWHLCGTRSECPGIDLQRSRRGIGVETAGGDTGPARCCCHRKTENVRRQNAMLLVGWPLCDGRLFLCSPFLFLARRPPCPPAVSTLKPQSQTAPVAVSIKTADFLQHPADMRVIATGLQDMVTFPGIAPFQNLNSDAANTPIIHFASGRTVKVNGVPA